MRRCLLALLLLVGCKDDAAESFETLQDCYIDHTEEEALPDVEAAVVCCLDHPIMGEAPSCGDTAADCINHLTNEIDQTDISTVDIMTACMMYEEQLDM
jgi:hypothetical protein